MFIVHLTHGEWWVIQLTSGLEITAPAYRGYKYWRCAALDSVLTRNPVRNRSDPWDDEVPAVEGHRTAIKVRCHLFYPKVFRKGQTCLWWAHCRSWGRSICAPRYRRAAATRCRPASSAPSARRMPSASSRSREKVSRTFNSLSFHSHGDWKKKI